MAIFEKLYIQAGAAKGAIAARARRMAGAAQVVEFGDLAALLADIERLGAEAAKRRLVVARRAGGFVKRFPGGAGVRAPGWHYFIPGIGCPADCRYCFLQGYHPAGAPVVFDDTDAMLDEIRRTSQALGGGYFYGGELCDSLMLEEAVGSVAPLADLFRELPTARLEFRTKSAAVEPLLEVEPPENALVSWTFSPRTVAERFETGAAPWQARIDAAGRVGRARWRVGVRFDPIILVPDWRREYSELVAALFSALDPAQVDSVQMGCLRFTPQLKSIVSERFGASAPFDAEFVVSSDGKLRYPRPVRVAAYAYIRQLLAAAAPEVPVTLCMETASVQAGVSL